MSYISINNIKARLDSLKEQFNFEYIVNEIKGVSGEWYVSLDPIDLGWTPDTSYIADFKSQYGYGPDSSNMYYDYDWKKKDNFEKALKRVFPEQYFTIDEFDVSTEYCYVEFRLVQNSEEQSTKYDSDDTKLFPTINVLAYNNGKMYDKTIEERPNMVGEDVRDLLKKTFVNFLDTSDIFYCCTLNDSNYLGYHSKDNIDYEKFEVFEKFERYSNWEKILEIIQNELPGITALDTIENKITIKFEPDYYAFSNNIAEYTIDEIKRVLRDFNTNIRYSINIMNNLTPKDNFRNNKYIVIQFYPKIEKFIKF